MNYSQKRKRLQTEVVQDILISVTLFRKSCRLWKYVGEKTVA